MKFNVRIKNTVSEGLKKARTQVDREITQIAREVADKLMEESVKRSPVDEGFLEKSHSRKVEEVPDGADAIVYIPGNSPAADYAIYMHDAQYNLGPRSAEKQSGAGVIVGRKYMERALYENIDKFQKFIASRLRRKIQ